MPGRQRCVVSLTHPRTHARARVRGCLRAHGVWSDGNGHRVRGSVNLVSVISRVSSRIDLVSVVKVSRHRGRRGCGGDVSHTAAVVV